MKSKESQEKPEDPLKTGCGHVITATGSGSMQQKSPFRLP